MKPRSKIYLKGRPEPIMVSESTAKKVDEAFLNQEISLHQPMSAGGVSFVKDSIKSIDVIKDEEEDRGRKPYWIIYHPKGNCVYDSFPTYQAASAEYQFSGLAAKGWELVQK